MRPTRRILLALCAGLIAAVCTTWLLALAVPVPMYPRTGARGFVQWDRPWYIAQVSRFGVDDRWWGDAQSDSPGKPPQTIIDTLLSGQRARTDANRPSVILDTPPPPTWGLFASSEPPPPTLEIGSDTAFGWPARCAWYQLTGTLRGSRLLSDRLIGGIKIAGTPSARGRDFRALPLRPIWTGLLLNTLLYSAMLWTLLALVRIARRRRRARRGLCAHCAYDLRATPPGAPCPECGTPAR